MIMGIGSRWSGPKLVGTFDNLIIKSDQSRVTQFCESTICDKLKVILNSHTLWLAPLWKITKNVTKMKKFTYTSLLKVIAGQSLKFNWYSQCTNAVMIKKHARPTVVLDEMRKLQAVNYLSQKFSPTTKRPSAENLTNWNIRYTFSSNYNIHKSLCGLYFWASDPLIERF